MADIRGMTALGGRPGCDVRVSQGTRGSRRGTFELRLCSDVSTSPQVGPIPDRKCNGSPELRQNKSVEFKISEFLHTAGSKASHEKTESNMSGLVVSTVQLFSCPAVFLSLLLCRSVFGF